MQKREKKMLHSGALLAFIAGAPLHLVYLQSQLSLQMYFTSAYHTITRLHKLSYITQLFRFLNNLKHFFLLPFPDFDLLLFRIFNRGVETV